MNTCMYIYIYNYNIRIIIHIVHDVHLPRVCHYLVQHLASSCHPCHHWQTVLV